MEATEASTSYKRMIMHAAMVPAGTQTSPFLQRKVLRRRKEGTTDFPEEPTVTTRLTQKKKYLIPPKPPEPLPDLSRLSGLLVQAITSCKTDDGLNFPELKKMLKGQGYDVTKRCPSLKRKLRNLASKGALVHMANNDGSTLFVIRKYPEKAAARRVFEGSMQTDETKQEGAARRKNLGNSGKTKGAARQAKCSGWKPGEASGRLQSLDKKLKPGEKQQSQPTSRCGSAKESQSLIKKTISTTKSQHRSSGIRDMPTTQGPRHSNENTAATSKRSVNTRNRTSSTAKKLPSSASLIPTRSRLSASNIKLAASLKNLESPYSKESHTGKKARRCKSKPVLPSEGQKHLRKKSTISLQDSRAVVQPVRKSKRRRQKDWM